MIEELFSIFERSKGQSDNCWKQVNILINTIPEKYKPIIRRIYHKSNLFNNNIFYCEHVCSESFTQHFVVEVENYIFDLKLDNPISTKKYLKLAYLNYNDLLIS